MTDDDGADKQPVTEAPASAPAVPPAADPPAAPEAVLPTPETPTAPAVEAPAAVADVPTADVTIEASAEPTPALESQPPGGSVGPPQRVESVPDAVIAPEPEAELIVPVAVEDKTATVSAPIPMPVAAASKPQREMGPMIEYASWRLVELVVTVAVAAVVFALLFRAETPANPIVLVERLAVTVPLVLMALIVGTLVGVPTGYAAARFGSWLDAGLRALATLGTSLAPIWLAMALVLLFAATLGWLQPGGFVPWLQSPVGALASLVLPALALGLPLAADMALALRDAIAKAQRSPAIDTAETMGFSRREAVRAFALRGAFADAAGRLIVPLALIVPASLVIENVFYLPGLGRLIFTALSGRDFGTLQIGLVALVALIGLCRMLVLLLRATADSRIARRA